MKIGIEDTQLFDTAAVGGAAVLQWAASEGLDGVAFKNIAHVAPTLDLAQLATLRAQADELGLYMELGIGTVNPFNIPEDPWVRDIGGGDTLAGFRRMIEAAAAVGCTELLVTTAHWKGKYPGRWSFDRFRTDVSWAVQLDVIGAFLERLAPILRANGCRVVIETHEEISSFEVVALVERVGTDVAAIAFDVGNVLCRGEDPVAAAHRVAPYVSLTHVKDAILVPDGDSGSLVRWLRPCGQGIVDWPALLAPLHAAAPALRLTLEDNQNPKLIELGDPEWLAAHPDLPPAEIAAQRAFAQHSVEQIAAGSWAAAPTGGEARWTREQKLARLLASRDHLRSLERTGAPNA